MRDKHFSIVQKIVNYGNKKFYNIGPQLRIFKSSEQKVSKICHRIRKIFFCSFDENLNLALIGQNTKEKS